MNATPATPERTLFDPLPVYRRGHGTQMEAAARVASSAGVMRERVLAFIKEKGGAHNEEVALALGMKLATVCARCNELQKARLVAFRGRLGTTTSGCSAKIWEAV
jgi:predicted transcriptional regulator